MEHLLAYSRTLSRLIHLLRHPGSTMGEVRDTLRLLVAEAREAAIVFELDEWRLSIGGTPVPSASTGFEELIGQLYAHRVSRLAIRQFATAAELIKLTRLLSEAPSGGPDAFARRVAELKLWNVQVSASGPGEHGARGEASASPERVVLAHHLARVRTATLPLDATHAIAELVAMAEAHAAAGNAELVAEVLVGVTRLERDAAHAASRDACGRCIDRLAKPPLTRLVAQLLPGVRGRPAEWVDYLAALGRCGTAGAAALIAHLMAADTLEDRRAFFDAVVELRAGIPMLIDALGHPQWYVVRNAACLLGEMRAGQADGALARLLEHRDERVREAAAEALSRIETPTARAALRRMLHDHSPNVRLHAASAFAAAGQGRAATASPLAAALDAESDGDVQLGILAALGRLGTPDAVQKLVKAVHGGGAKARPVSYRVAALEALAQARGPSALPTLRMFAADGDQVIRETVRRLIATAALG